MRVGIWLGSLCLKLPIFVSANNLRSRPSSSVTCGDTFSAGEGFGRMRTLIAAVLQVKASCFSRTVGDAGPYKLVRTGCDFPQQMIFSRSRKRTYHICEANISLRSNFTCPLGQISLRNCLAVAPWGPQKFAGAILPSVAF